MKIWKRLHEMDWKEVRVGAREVGGARAFLRAVRRNLFMWAAIVFGIWSGSFVLLAVLAVCAMFGATCMDWTLEGYKKMLEGYGTMVDQQHKIIHSYQRPFEYESEKAARARLN